MLHDAMLHDAMLHRVKVNVRNVQLEVTFPLAVPPLTPMRKGRCRGRSASLKGSDTSMMLQRCRFLLNN